MDKIGTFFKKAFSKECLKKFFDTYIWLMVIIFVIDIVTKWVVLNHFGVEAANQQRHSDTGAIEVIKGFAYIGIAINDGAAFSALSGKRVILLLISLVMTGGFIFYYIKNYKKLSTPYRIALALMIAGGFGNLIDRAFYWESTVGIDGVIDWIIFRFGPTKEYEFAMFNIADSGLVIGILICAVTMIVEAINEKTKKTTVEQEVEPKNEENKGE